MNIYQLMFKFRKTRNESCISTAAQALYYELLSICNETQWKEVFFVRSNFLCAILSMSDNTLRKSRSILADAGLIFYKTSKDKRIGCYYSFVRDLDDDAVLLACSSAEPSLEFEDDESVSSAASSAASCSTVEDEIQIPPIKRINKTKDKENITHENENSLSAKLPSSRKRAGDAKELVYPFSSAEFLSSWETLRATPKWKKKLNYALQLSLDKLGRYEEEFAIRQMQRATESNWTGVVFTGTERDYQQWLNQKYATNQHYGNNQQYANNQHNRASGQNAGQNVGQNVGLRSAGIKSISFG